MRALAVTLLTLGAVGAVAARGAEPDPDPVAPLLQQAPRTTCTNQGAPGDPLNVALVGTREGVVRALGAAGWVPADPITVRSAIKISASVVFDVAYPRAPVSDLYLAGRRQDLAFEQPAGRSPRSRHHVRLWCWGPVGGGGLWLGAATFDVRVGRSSTTGRITHHIAPDVDRERDKVLGDLWRAGRLGTATTRTATWRSASSAARRAECRRSRA